jgi:hypothetical protein
MFCHHEEAFRPTRDLLFDRLKRKQIPRPTEVGLVMTTYKFAMAQLKLRSFEEHHVNELSRPHS